MKIDIQSLKIDLIHWLTQLNDVDTLKQLSAIKESRDWWDEISLEEQQAIDEGIAQLDRGEGIPHEQALQSIHKLSVVLREAGL